MTNKMAVKNGKQFAMIIEEGDSPSNQCEDKNVNL